MFRGTRGKARRSDVGAPKRAEASLPPRRGLRGSPWSAGGGPPSRTPKSGEDAWDQVHSSDDLNWEHDPPPTGWPNVPGLDGLPLPPNLAARRRGGRRGRALARPQLPQAPLLPQQKLLLLDTWQRSGLPARDFGAMVNISRHTLYAWKRRFEELGRPGRPRAHGAPPRPGSGTTRPCCGDSCTARLADCPMAYRYAVKKQRRYPYYVCRRAIQRGSSACPARQCPAARWSVRLRPSSGSWVLRRATHPADSRSQPAAGASRWDKRSFQQAWRRLPAHWESLSPDGRSALVHRLIERIVYDGPHRLGLGRGGRRMIDGLRVGDFRDR